MSDKPTSAERNQEYIEKLLSTPSVRGIEKVSKAMWKVTTEEGQKTAYLHYCKWFKESGGPKGYFQGSWNLTESADRPLYHVFLGPSEDSVRVVPNQELMSAKFVLIRDHEGGKQWRLNANTAANYPRLEQYDDETVLTN
ncbi:hypothetical protein E4P24_02095 [Haloferax sp. AS1]|uniref:hypothetical protein n=1 Tax=Haloferax sp. AS1 TaxID=2562277 RepID=UPI00165F210D|nr:hypothetical protein [Haloferax sp. AS1]MBC9985164.1 hypothetical protein [Haloferax sp. AS1]